LHGGVQAHEATQLSPNASVNEFECNLECKENVYNCLKFDLCQMMMLYSDHVLTRQTLSKMNEFGLFGKIDQEEQLSCLTLFHLKLVS
jgi:hypothetical protein